MKIVVLDGYCENPGDLSWEVLSSFGDLSVYDRTPSDEDTIVSRIGDAEIVLTNKTPISARTLSACPSIRFIGVLATGYNIVDVAAAKERGIPVCNVPGYATEDVAQFSIALLLELCHHVGAHSDSVFAGKWAACPDYSYSDFPLISLSGKTLGIIGFGRIGRRLGKIASVMGMKILATGSRVCPEGEAIADYVDLDSLLRDSDVVSINCPLLPETRDLLNRENLMKMRSGAFLINTGRGPVINEQDVADALRNGQLGGYAADVVSVEPILADNPLLTAPNCILTPHIAWASKECRVKIMEITEANIKAFLAGTVKNRVNA